MDISAKEGYSKVAQLMASHDEFAILRRFKLLNMQNLLYLQAEITHLEAELTELVQQDMRDPNREYFARDWWSLSQGGSDEERLQWEKSLELREKLDVYNDTLLKQSRIARLAKPRKYDLIFLRSWFERPGMGAFPLLGLDRTSWDVQYEEDLVGIKTRSSPDPLTRWFVERLVPVVHHVVGGRFKEPMLPEKIGTGIYNYSDGKLAAIVQVISTVTASMLPLCSIIALYIIPNNGVRLGLVVMFSACFSFALAMMTNARTIEVFAATAAFAAVNVVFLTNTPMPDGH